MDALNGEIQRLRQLKEECGKLSRSNQRKLKKYKKLFQQRTGASVLYPEDCMHVPKDAHVKIIYALKDLDRLLKTYPGTSQDGRFFELIFSIFDFEVSHDTVRRYYYMSDDSRNTGK